MKFMRIEPVYNQLLMSQYTGIKAVMYWPHGRTLLAASPSGGITKTSD